MRINSDNKTHKAACVTAEMTRQNAVAAAIAAIPSGRLSIVSTGQTLGLRPIAIAVILAILAARHVH
jgi:hypothetical protein